MSDDFYTEIEEKTKRCNILWYKDNLLNVLQAAKEKRVREIDASIALARKLITKLDEPLLKPAEVPLRNVIPSKDDSLMKPIESDVLNIIRKSTEKGATERYMKVRNKKAPEDKFFYRIVTSWDYGWQQIQAKQRARDVNHGRCAIMRETFYRRNNLGPDPLHYSLPAGGETSICSEYTCNFN